MLDHATAARAAVTPAPATVRAAAHAALDRERIGYTNALGIPALRTAIAQHYRDRLGVEVDAANVVVSTGSSGAVAACGDRSVRGV